MPKSHRKTRASRENIYKGRVKISRLGLNNNEEHKNHLRNGINNEPDNFIDRFVQENCKCGKTQIELKDAATQSDEYVSSSYVSFAISHFNFYHVQDLICILFDSISNYNLKHRRILSIIVYLILRLVNVSFQATRTVLENLNLLRIQTAHSWCLTIIDEDDLCVILRDERGAYKGLLQIAKEAKVIPITISSRDIKLHELREKMLSHPAFVEKNTNLEKLASKYDINIIWCPKYHCELNPIEGVWCDSKRYVRSQNEQDYNKLLLLIEASLDQYENKQLSIKLWYRFWRSIEMYDSGSSYQQVLETLFGAKSSLTKSHKKNTHFNNALK